MGTRSPPRRYWYRPIFLPRRRELFGMHYVLAINSGARIALIHILEPIVPPSFEGLSMPLDMTAEPSGASENLKVFAASARKRRTTTITATLRRGIASHEIVEAAKELDADLIVMATHGYTGWKHFCIGSTAERVVRAAPCPVLVVREKEHEFC